jgi:hypothetical protein
MMFHLQKGVRRLVRGKLVSSGKTLRGGVQMKTIMKIGLGLAGLAYVILCGMAGHNGEERK